MTEDRKIVTIEDRDLVLQHVMHSIAITVSISNVRWDPFNIKLVVRAQREPKPKNNTV